MTNDWFLIFVFLFQYLGAFIKNHHLIKSRIAKQNLFSNITPKTSYILIDFVKYYKI